jgi:hypothetical protein
MKMTRSLCTFLLVTQLEVLESEFPASLPVDAEMQASQATVVLHYASTELLASLLVHSYQRE